MRVTDTQEMEDGLLATLLANESFWPAPPRTIEETGLTDIFIESLICKYLSVCGTSSGRNLGEELSLPFGILEGLFTGLRTRQLLVHAGAAPFNDYYYTLTEQGRHYAQACLEASAYVGPAPVPLVDYVLSVEAQATSAEAPQRDDLLAAFSGISMDSAMLDSLGPAVNSGAGMFLYGAPGNGKSTLAKRITKCFGQEIWVPHALIEAAQVIKLYDAAYHVPVNRNSRGVVKAQEHDRRWVRIRRPTVVVGGELTMDNLEIQHNPRSNVSEAPLQMKSNCGCLLLDDFGRQRIAPAELLNRWIIPLECRYDFLTLATGKKIQVPFEQLIIFSTNLEPRDLVDEAFLRRIPYKIEIGDPTEQEFQFLFQLYAQSMGCEYRRDVVQHLIHTHYRPLQRPMRRCHPRDLLIQVRNYCRYNDYPLEMRAEYFDLVVKSYFTMVLGTE